MNQGTDKIFNNDVMKRRRQCLRRNMPQPERLLWLKIRGCQIDGYKFRRQFSVDRYVLDFYCVSEKIAIEIDGDSHFSPKAIVYDTKRQVCINDLGIRVLRFTNREVTDNIEGVITKIKEELNPSKSPLQKERLIRKI